MVTGLTGNTRVRAALGRLLQAGFSEQQVARWFGVPLVTDARYVPSSARRSVRKGIGGWIAVLVGGETLPLSDLGVLEDVEALMEGGFLERQGDRVRARVALLPVMGLLLASDRIDEAGADAVVMIDLSALNLARCLPSKIAGRSLDVGCGAGLLALLCARAGAEALGSDIDRRSLQAAAINAEINQLAPRWFVSDLMQQVPRARFELVTFNAPLLKAQLANPDPAAPSSYYTSPRGETLALEFLGELPRFLSDTGGEALVQAQLTDGTEAALDELAKDHQVGSIRFAEAPDGTPHAMIAVRKGEPMRRKLSVTLGPLCPAVDRRMIEALLAPRELRPALVPLPAPWLELRQSRQLDPRAARPWRQVRFGSHVIDDEELALLERLDGRPVADLNPAEIEKLRRLVELGLILLQA